MSIEDLLRDIKDRKLYVSNLYEGADKIWRCFLRTKLKELPSIHRGQGATMFDALKSAIPPLVPSIEDLIGE